MHVVDMIYFWARSMPSRAAMIHLNGIVTYRSLALAIEAAADVFRNEIEDKSRPVGVIIDSPTSALVASLGLMRAGFNILPVSDLAHERLSAIGVTHIVRESGSASIAGFRNVNMDPSILRFGNNTAGNQTALPQISTGRAHPYFFTSGTTGVPKIAPRTHRDWEQRILFSGNSCFTEFERALVIPSMTTSFGFTRACEVLYAGKAVCIAARSDQALWLINAYDIDMVIAAPVQALALADYQAKNVKYSMASLKSIRLGGSLVAVEGIQRIKDYLCSNIIVIYSSTELGTVAVAQYDMIAEIPNAAGFIVPGVEVEIIDVEGAALPLDTEGIVRMRTPQYIDKLPADASDTWFYPGDIGLLTEHGMLCIAGKQGDVINRGGVKLSANRIERFLLECAGVADVGICPVPGNTGIEEIWIGIVPGADFDLKKFQSSVDLSSLYGGNIDKLFLIDRIPRGALGKTQRTELRQLLQRFFATDNGFPENRLI